MRFFIILLLLLPLNFHTHANEVGCDDVISEILEVGKSNKNLNLETIYPVYNYGFFLSETFDFENQRMVFKRKNGYPSVSTFLDLELYNQKVIKSGDQILNINNKNAQIIEDDELYEIFYSNKDNQKKIDIEFLSLEKNKKFKLSLNQKEYNYYSTTPRFQISSINEIDTVKGNFEVYYNFSYDQLLPELGKVISKYDFFELSECPINEEDAGILSFGQTPPKFLNRSMFSEDELETGYAISLERIEEKSSSDYLPSGIFTTSEEAIAKFKNDFDFKKFPFDKQQLKISLMEMYGLYPDTSLQFENTQLIFESLDYYTNNNLLKEWEITSFDIILKTTNLIGYELPSSQLDIIINIQRNFLYYIIKIILPIFLILFLAWSVFWIGPKELESRITTSIVCFLALVAYNFVIDNEIPKLGYLTFMDWVIMISYIFCALPTLISIFLYQLNTKKYDVLELNNYIRFIGLILYFALLSAVGLIILA